MDFADIEARHCCCQLVERNIDQSRYIGRSLVAVLDRRGWNRILNQERLVAGRGWNRILNQERLVAGSSKDSDLDKAAALREDIAAGGDNTGLVLD